MRKHMAKVLAVVVLATMTLSSCSIGGKKLYFSTGLSKNELFKIDGSSFNVSEAMLYLTTEKNLYEKSYGSDIWDKNIGGVTLEEYVKENIKKHLAEIKTLNLLAKNKKVKLTDDEVARAEAAADLYYNALSAEEIEYMDVTLKNVEKAYKEYILADKVYIELTKDINPEISDAEAKVIKVASIYAKTYTIDTEGNRVEYTDDEKVKSKNGIQELLDEIKNGEDFMILAANNTDADQVEYQFGRGDMIEEFENAAYSLKADEVSEVIETGDGYYVIKCISDYMENETNQRKEKMVQQAKEEYFNSIYTPFVDALSSEFNDNVWEGITFKDMSAVKVSNFYECIK